MTEGFSGVEIALRLSQSKAECVRHSYCSFGFRIPTPLCGNSDVLVQESGSSSPISLVMITLGRVAPRYMGPAMPPRRALPGTILAHRNSHRTSALLH